MQYINRYKLFEDLQKARKILKQYNKTEEDIKELKALVSKNPGYLGKFTEWLLSGKSSMDELIALYDKLKSFKLDKPIDNFNSAEEAYDYIQREKIYSDTSQIINSIPSNTRKLVDDHITDTLMNSTEYKDKLINFLSKKGGRYKTSTELYNAIYSFISDLSGGWSMESILNKVNSSQIIFKDAENDILIIEVKFYKDCKILGSKFWCIADDKSYWDEYIADGTNRQYIIYDFNYSMRDKESMIGVTVKYPDIIEYAHYRNDDDALGDEVISKYKEYLKSITYDELYNIIDVNDIHDLMLYNIENLIINKIANNEYDDIVSIYSDACQYNNLNVVKYIIENKLMPEKYIRSGITTATFYHNTEISNYLYQQL